MKSYELKQIKQWAQESLKAGPTGNALLDSKYDWYKNLVAHEVPYYRLFYKLAQELKPEFVVELGSYRATASAHFAVGNPKSTVVTIDIHKDDKEAQADVIQTVRQINNLHYINKWTWDAVEDVRAFNKSIDILFVDAWHREDLVKREWDLFSPLLSEGALVICDDLMNAGGLFEGMEEWWDTFPYDKFVDGGVHTGVPMGFFKYVSSNRQTGGTGGSASKQSRTGRAKRKVSTDTKS